ELVEVRNQARVHLQFEGKSGDAYGPLSCSAEALERFTSSTFAIRARMERHDRMTIRTPIGLEDRFSLRLRHNPVSKTNWPRRTAEAARRRWPELEIVEAG